MRVLGAAVAAACALTSGVAGAAAFTPGNIVVYRIGDGSAALTGAATAVFIDERTTAGTLVQSIALPVAVNGLNQACTAAGTATTEGFLTRSADGQYLVGGCYAATPGTGTPNASAPGAVPRVVFRVDSAGNVGTTTSIGSATATGNIRGAASSNGTDLWFVTSTGGNHYATLGATTATQISTTATNVRTVQIESGQLYGGSGAGTFRLYTVGTGLPTTAGQTMVNLPGYPTGTLSGNAFFFADLNAGVAGVDTVYQADDAGGTGGIKKYSLVGGSWAVVASDFIQVLILMPVCLVVAVLAVLRCGASQTGSPPRPRQPAAAAPVCRSHRKPQRRRRLAPRHAGAQMPGQRPHRLYRPALPQRQCRKTARSFADGAATAEVVQRVGNRACATCRLHPRPLCLVMHFLDA